MKQMELEPKTKAVLDRIRHTDKVLSIFEMPADLAELAVWEIGKLALADEPVPLVQQNGYRWYLRELSRLLRTKTEWDLALEIEICLRKWVAYGLDPGLLQMLVCECHERIGAMTAEEVEENPKSETRMTNQPGKPEARMPKPGSTTKTRRREEDTRGKGTSTDSTDSADCVPASGTNNEGRRTMNVPLTVGGGNA